VRDLVGVWKLKDNSSARRINYHYWFPIYFSAPVKLNDKPRVHAENRNKASLVDVGERKELIEITKALSEKHPITECRRSTNELSSLN
jgi:hypothetical protein